MPASNKPKFYGRRIGRKIRVAKSGLLDVFLPQVKFESFAPFAQNFKQMCLEIGFGDGGHLAEFSARHKEVGFIGAEVFQNGVANLLSLLTGVKEGKDLEQEVKLKEGRADNVRVFADDVRLLFEKIPDNSIDTVFVLFPDPWPKKRHADRRFICRKNLNEIARILKTGGKLLVATDHPIYKRWTLEQLHKREDLVWTAKCGTDWKNEPQDWVQTKYQQKALREGRRPVFLEYQKI